MQLAVWSGLGVHVRSGKGGVDVLAPETLVVAAVVGAFVADHAEELVVPSIEEGAEGEALRERNFGEIFGGGTAHVEDGAREVDYEDLGKLG